MRWFAPLRRSGEIAFVRRTGRRSGSETVATHVASSRSGPSRVAVSVAKSVGTAVVRNRVKRRVKGALDALPAPQPPVRIVIIARAQAAALPYAMLARDISASLGRVTKA